VRGIRCGDILRVTKDELQGALKTGTLAFESKGKRRQEYSAAPMRPYLEALDDLWWRPDSTHVRHLVSNSHKESAALKAVSRGFKKVAERLKMDPGDIYPHRFRHTYVTHFLQAMAGDPEAVFKLQDQMAWARLETASNYLRRSRREELDVIESRLLGLK
jgi:integrase